MHPVGARSGAGAPPWEVLHTRLLERCEAMRAAGDDTGAAVLHAQVETWWMEQCAWTEALRTALTANHEVNNALVGVSGNVQLLLLAPVGQTPSVRERLQTIQKEAERIEHVMRDLGETKARLGLSAGRVAEGGNHGGFPAHSR